MLRRIVIAEDHPTTRQMLQALLDGEPGLRVIGTAVDGEDAVNQVFALLPDVLLMDIRMPKMSGLDASRRLRRLGFAGRIVALSTYDDEAARLACRLSGVDALVSKTDSLANIITAITDLGPDGAPAPPLTHIPGGP